MPKSIRGGVYKRNDSPFLWIYYYDKENKRRCVSSGTADKKAAYSMLSVLSSSKGGKKVLTKKYRHGLEAQLLTALRDQVASGRKSKGSVTIEMFRLRRFIKYCETQRDIRFIEEVDDEVLKAFMAWLQRTHSSSNSTVNRYLDTICSLLPQKVAIRRLRRGRGIGKEIPQNVLKSILEAAEPRFRQFLVLLAETALRTGHLCKIEWDWIKEYDLGNEKRFFISFPAGTYHERKRAPLVPLNEIAMSIITSQPRYGKYVFSLPSGAQLFTKDRVSHRWRRLVKKINHPEFRAYDLRHTWAIREIIRTGDISYVAAVLGHTTPATTLSYYQNLSNTRILERSRGSGITSGI